MSAPETINVTLKVWRQNGPDIGGHFETIAVNDVDTHSSFLDRLIAAKNAAMRCFGSLSTSMTALKRV